jgi:hypothetical protein
VKRTCCGVWPWASSRRDLSSEIVVLGFGRTYGDVRARETETDKQQAASTARANIAFLPVAMVMQTERTQRSREQPNEGLYINTGNHGRGNANSR